MSVAFIQVQVRPPGYFVHVSITTPIVSALKSYYRWGFLEVPTDILNHFWIQVAVSLLKPPLRLQIMTVICNGHSRTDTRHKCPFGCNGCVTAMAMAVGQSQRQRLYSGVRMFTGNYLSSTPRKLRVPGVYLERRPLMYKGLTCVLYKVQNSIVRNNIKHR